MHNRYQDNHGNTYQTTLKNTLKCLRRTKDIFLVYGGREELRFMGYIDASFRTDRDESCSQSGWVFLIIGGAVTWKSSRQKIMQVALTNEPKDNGNSIHIFQKYHYVRNHIKDGEIIMNAISSKENLVDPFMKPLSRTKHDSHTRSINIRFANDMAYCLVVSLIYFETFNNMICN